MQETRNRIESAITYILNTDKDATIKLINTHLDWHDVAIELSALPEIEGGNGAFGVCVQSSGNNDVNEEATKQLIAELGKQLPEYLWY